MAFDFSVLAFPLLFLEFLVKLLLKLLLFFISCSSQLSLSFAQFIHEMLVNLSFLGFEQIFRFLLFLFKFVLNFSLISSFEDVSNLLNSFVEHRKQNTGL